MNTESNRIKINPFMGLVEIFSNKIDINDSVDENDYELKKEINASYARCDEIEKKHAGYIIDESVKENKINKLRNRLNNNSAIISIDTNTLNVDEKEHEENEKV